MCLWQSFFVPNVAVVGHELGRGLGAPGPGQQLLEGDLRRLFWPCGRLAVGPGRRFRAGVIGQVCVFLGHGLLPDLKRKRNRAAQQGFANPTREKKEGK